MTYNYLFGPVPSRRLGISLGVDLVPKKVCSLNCVYCEAGKTTKLTTERKEYVPFEKIKAELSHYFNNSPDPDYITFSGSGEPLLNNRLGDVIDFIKSNKPNTSVAVLTNGTLFSDPSVRKELLNADLILPSLDAATQEVFEKINRPQPGISIKDAIDGLIKFSSEFTGKIWLEVFILPGYNDSRDELDKIRKVIEKISPDSIQLNTLDRPGTVTGIVPASTDLLNNIKQIWGLENVEIIASPKNSKENIVYRKDAESAILETITRRPCTMEDLENILGMHHNDINKYVDDLERQGRITSVRQERGLFYQILEHE